MSLFEVLLRLLLGFLTLFGIGGCQLFQPNTEPIERGVTTVVENVVKPAVAKATDELSARTAMVQGQGSLINPGYEVEAEGGMFNGFKMKMLLRLTGVSANIAGAGQGDAGQSGTVPPPATRPPPNGDNGSTGESPPE